MAKFVPPMDNIFDPTQDLTSGTITVRAEAQRHLAALRIRPGEHVRILNGRGGSATCVAVQSGKDGVTLQIEDVQFDPPPSRAVVLCLGIMDHRDRFEIALEKCTELGITHLQPVRCDHSQRGRFNEERAMAKAEAALTQCGRTWMPTILEPRSVQDLVTSIPTNATVVLGDMLGNAPVAISGDVWMIIGPEGGLSQREDALIRQLPSLQCWRIGAHRLRAETAAIAVTSFVIGR